MRTTIAPAARTALALLLVVGNSSALSIYDVQHSSAANSWQSPHAGQLVDVSGGVVTYVGRPPGKQSRRVVIQDPSFSEWAGVEIKIFDGALAESVQLADRVDLTNVYVDESSKTYGTTYLIFDAATYGSGFAVAGTAAVAPLAVGPSALGAGDQSADPAATEKYEGMLLRIQNVTIGSLGLGSHNDNYELTGSGGTCWATDYFNLDRSATELYHDWTEAGKSYSAVIGILEQYTKTSDQYDYYQLLTRTSGDFVPEPASGALLLAGGAVLWAKRRRTVHWRRERRHTDGA